MTRAAMTATPAIFPPIFLRNSMLPPEHAVCSAPGSGARVITPASPTTVCQHTSGERTTGRGGHPHLRPRAPGGRSDLHLVRQLGFVAMEAAEAPVLGRC